MSTMAELVLQKNDLLTKAEAFTARQDLTDADVESMRNLKQQIIETKASIKQIADRNEILESLKSESLELKKTETVVPAANRPAHVYNVSDKRSQNFLSKGAPGVLDRRMLPSVELNREDYLVLKKDGYSDDTIQNCASDGFIDEFREYMRTGGRSAPPMVLKSMTEGGAGGVLVPLQWGDLITNPPMMGMLRGAVRNMSVTSLSMRFPRIQTSNVKYPAYPVTVAWGGEQPTSVTNPDQGSNFATTNIDIQVGEVYAQGLFSISLLEDNAYSLSSYIPQVFQESLDVDLDARIISGTGTSVANSPQPWGLNETGVVPTVNATTTGATAKVTYQDLLNLMYQLPQQYRATGVWLMNSRTLGAISGLVDSNGRPLFLPGYGYIGETPGGGTNWMNGSILGRPLIISENMPDIAQTNVSMYFADFNKLYFLLTRVGPTVRVLDQPQYTTGNYVFALRARFGGRVVQPYAGLGLKHT